MELTHLAHAGFLIENGKERLIIDPPDNSFGYEMKDEVVNYLLVSHEHWDHNNTENIMVKDNVGSFKISKIDSYHDNQKGALRGPNIIHIIETENKKICHLGDLGHILTAEQIKLIGKIDLLLMPIGGVFTINYLEALEVIKQLQPLVIIPMHYATENWGNDKGIDKVDKFINSIKGYKIINLANNKLNYLEPSEKTVYII